MLKQVFKKVIVAILTWQAKAVLRKYNPKIIGVTGSVGKTSTKDAIYTVLKDSFFVRKSEKSFNSEIGVPLTILGCPNGWGNPIQWLENLLEGFVLVFLPNRYPEWLVLEIGADRPGDIQSITSWVRPDIAVVTRLSKVPVHVEYFRAVAEVLQEKSFLVRNLKRGGTAVLNADDEDVMAFQSFLENKAVSYGISHTADIKSSHFRINYQSKKPSGISFKVFHNDSEGEVHIHEGLGVQQMYPTLAALAVGSSMGLSMEVMIKSLESYTPSRGRMRILPGLKGSTLIDDTYNSSPVALHEALSTLEKIKAAGTKIAVLGDMLELGVHSTEEHKKAGQQAAGACNVLVTVGVRARFIAEGALNAGFPENNIFQFEGSREAGKYVESILGEGDVVLIKGSQGVRMERAVEEVMAEPQKKEEFLVRQDKEWMNR
jgi:UDP-N-acetylmuramoyl-tripeptide--D-alanyl-D-alanine ligase